MNAGIPKNIAVVSLRAENLPEAVHFYRDVLGLSLLPYHAGGRPHFKIGGVYLVILSGTPQPAGQERFPALAFAVDDLEAAAANLTAHQVELPWGIESDGPGRWVMFHDPAGNLLELVQVEAQS